MIRTEWEEYIDDIMIFREGTHDYDLKDDEEKFNQTHCSICDNILIVTNHSIFEVICDECAERRCRNWYKSKKL